MSNLNLVRGIAGVTLVGTGALGLAAGVNAVNTANTESGTLICASCSVAEALRGCSVVDGECTCPEKLEGAGWAYTGPAMDVSMEVRGVGSIAYEQPRPADGNDAPKETEGAGSRYEISFNSRREAVFTRIG